MLQTFDISPRKFVHYLLTLEAHYLNVPYHNSMHAADVCQAVHVLLLSPALDVSYIINIIENIPNYSLFIIDLTFFFSLYLRILRS